MTAADAARQGADALLAAIAAEQGALESANAAAAAEIEQVRRRHARRIEAHTKKVAALEKELEALVKKHRARILAGADRADLAHGAVLLKQEERVKRIRAMLLRLKAAGKTGAIKVVESVDWDTVEKYDDATLAALGTKRVKKDRFSYEIKPTPPASKKG